MSIKKTIIFLILLLPLNVFALNKAPINITNTSIEELNKYLDEEIITSEDLVRLYLDRIETYKEYNAIISINENAINEAKELDKERQRGNKKSELHGIPIIVKDNIDVKGLPTTAGAKALKDNYPKEDAEVIKKLKAAGAIILAKSNMSEFAFMSSSSRSSYGTVKNAYNLEYSAYGSSGGSAVSVATSLSAAALGTDTNSSVRTPAAANYIVGYRPTYGKFSSKGVLPYDPERDTVGILTKSVKDNLIISNIISNKKIKIKTSSLEGYTFGISTAFLDGNDENSLSENKKTYNEINQLLKSAISKMEASGAKIIYLDSYYGTKENNLVSSSYSGFLFCNSFNEYIKNTTGTIRNFESLVKSSGKITSLDGYIGYCGTKKSLATKNANKQNYKEYITNIYNENKLDAIIYPTTKNKLLKTNESGIVNVSAHAAPTIGFPAISMPLGFDSDGLPYGIEFMGLENSDEKLINIVYNYEQLNVTNSNPTIAPNLYKVDTEVKKLITLYEKTTNKRNTRIIKKWQNKVKDYFKNYNKNKDVVEQAKILNKNYTTSKILSFITQLIKHIILFFLAVILVLIIRIKIRRKLRKKIKNKKNS